MAEMSLSLNSPMSMQATSATGGIAVDGAYDISFVFPKCTSGKLKGSSNGGSSYTDIAGSAFTGTGTNVPSISLIRCRFDHVQATFAGSGGLCVIIRRFTRQAPSPSLDRAVNITIADPIAGTA